MAKKISGILAEIIEPILKGGIAEYTPQFGEGHWSLRFPNLNGQEIKNLLSKYAKDMLK